MKYIEFFKTVDEAKSFTDFHFPFIGYCEESKQYLIGKSLESLKWVDMEASIGPDGSWTGNVNFLDKEFAELLTQNKTCIGAINELKQILDEHINQMYTTVDVEVSVLNADNVYVNTEVFCTDVTSGEQQTAVLDDAGHCQFRLEIGHDYKVSLTDKVNYYRVVENPIKTASKQSTTYTIKVQKCADERFVVLSNGYIYTWAEHQAAGAFPAGTTPELLRVGNSVLQENNGVFYLPVHRMKSVLTITPNWGTVNGDDIPELANATSNSDNTGEFDMERNTKIIDAYYNADNTAARIAMRETVTVNGVTSNGWLGTAEQYQQLLANNDTVKGWLEILGLNKEYFSSGLAGWTSSELRNSSGTCSARIIVNGAVQASPKVRSNAGISVLPFYKDVHKL